jgi:hypothetical protein
MTTVDRSGSDCEPEYDYGFLAQILEYCVAMSHPAKDTHSCPMGFPINQHFNCSIYIDSLRLGKQAQVVTLDWNPPLYFGNKGNADVHCFICARPQPSHIRILTTCEACAVIVPIA